MESSGQCTQILAGIQRELDLFLWQKSDVPRCDKVSFVVAERPRWNMWGGWGGQLAQQITAPARLT